MSSGVRTSQMAYFSFQRSSTPVPYSLGKPALNCCGGSLSTFGNMNRPVAASAAADAAEKAPHANPIQARRVSRGDVSSAARPVAGADAGRAATALAAAPPGDAALVVFPARSGIGAAGARGAGAALACAAAAGLTCAAGAGLATLGGAGISSMPGVVVSSAIVVFSHGMLERHPTTVNH